jgi:hypothetical protein
MCAAANESSAILLKVEKIVHQKTYETTNIGLTAIETSIIQMEARITGRLTLNQIWNLATAVRIQKPQGSKM